METRNKPSKNGNGTATLQARKAKLQGDWDRLKTRADNLMDKARAEIKNDRAEVRNRLQKIWKEYHSIANVLNDLITSAEAKRSLLPEERKALQQLLEKHFPDDPYNTDELLEDRCTDHFESPIARKLASTFYKICANETVGKMEALAKSNA